MRTIGQVLTGMVGGFKKSEIARRTVPCYKHIIERGGAAGSGSAEPAATRGELPPPTDGERLEVCLLVDSGKLYRFPYENLKGIRSLEVKARYLRDEMEHLRLREFQPGLCRYVNRIEKAG